MENCEIEQQDLFEKKDQKSLQQHFEEFRKLKMQNKQIVQQQQQIKNRSDEEKQLLREKFLELLYSYKGVPYCRANHPIGPPLNIAPIELDCCALVREAIYQMKDLLQIRFGPWNQAYMFDTLPLRYSSPQKEIKNGDLIFYIGQYVNTEKSPQKHNVVHVEVYDPLPENPKRCFGSRWNDGIVQHFESYEFVASSWKLEQIWFCSIDTWLNGVCKSFCEEHDWIVEEKVTNRKSIFYSESDYRAD